MKTYRLYVELEYTFEVEDDVDVTELDKCKK